MIHRSCEHVITIKMPRSPKTIDSARKLLVSTRVEALRAGHPQNLTLLRDNATIEQALQELARLMVLSAPVVSSCASDTVSDTVSAASDPTWPMGTPADDTLGFLDIRDILCSFLHGEIRACLAAMLATPVLKPFPWRHGRWPWLSPTAAGRANHGKLLPSSHYRMP